MLFVGLIIGVGGGYMVWRTGEMMRHLQRADRRHKWRLDDYAERLRRLEVKTKTPPPPNAGPPRE